MYFPVNLLFSLIWLYFTIDLNIRGADLDLDFHFGHLILFVFAVLFICLKGAIGEGQKRPLYCTYVCTRPCMYPHIYLFFIFIFIGVSASQCRRFKWLSLLFVSVISAFNFDCLDIGNKKVDRTEFSNNVSDLSWSGIIKEDLPKNVHSK